MCLCVCAHQRRRNKKICIYILFVVWGMGGMVGGGCYRVTRARISSQFTSSPLLFLLFLFLLLLLLLIQLLLSVSSSMYACVCVCICVFVILTYLSLKTCALHFCAPKATNKKKTPIKATTITTNKQQQLLARGQTSFARVLFPLFA